MLSHEEVSRYLIRRGLLRPDQIVRGGLSVVNASRRNRNFHVVAGEGPCYVIKQGIGSDKRRTLAREAGTYVRLHSSRVSPPLADFLPQFYRFEPDECLLVLEWIRDARPLSAAPHAITLQAARTLGEVLARLHHIPLLNADTMPVFVPFVFQVPRPEIRVLSVVSAAALELIRLVQQSEPLRCELEALRESWCPSALVHGDIRWDNCLEPRSSRNGRLRLVDWETSGRGDPCWDAAGVFSEILTYWILSAPIHKDIPPEQIVALVRYPLEEAQGLIRVFWNAWTAGLVLQPEERRDRLVRTVRLTGARLVQTALERLQKANQLTSEAVYVVQLAENLIRQPHEAAVHLLGVEL